MSLKLKCKSCGTVQIWDKKLCDIEFGTTYKCTGCGKDLPMCDAERISRLFRDSQLTGFEILQIEEFCDRENSDSVKESEKGTFCNHIFNADMAELARIYQESESEEKEWIADSMDKIFLILNRGKVDDTQKLHDAIARYYFEDREEKNSEL